MIHTISYNKLPQELRDILAAADMYEEKLPALRVQMCLGLKENGFITDDRIEVVRIEGEENYERLIGLKPELPTNLPTNTKSGGVNASGAW